VLLRMDAMMQAHNPKHVAIPDIDFSPFFYTPSDWSRFISAVGPEGAATFKWIGQVPDLIYPFFLASSIYLLWRKMYGHHWLFLLPYIAYFCDVIENILNGVIIDAYPFESPTPVVVVAAIDARNWFKLFKFVLEIPFLVGGVVLALGRLFAFMTSTGKAKTS